ncbi:mitochondrial carrier domain-containing protein [Lentinula aff. detonsa]|uniref:Mitochondrial carrier domain-containing protein n=1 Tax=Lentinula aff. detonsa TaxID=2804958 RepID=A0AA38L264_9AGAR|nr:mitochondrial carrier domain-containing protein [Lentinula aff. detonsa]
MSSSRPTSSSMGNISTPVGFVLGGIAAYIAVTISNPADVIKTRLQLQGELAKAGAVRVYQHAPDAFVKTWKNKGIRGLQRGLGPAYMYQILLNGSRLGFYEPFRRGINGLVGRSAEEQIPITSVLAGASSGAVGGSWSCNVHEASLSDSSLPLLGTLFPLSKHAYSPALPVGAQHHYKSSFDALSTIFRAEGFRRMVQGIDAAILRTPMGSSVQLPSYNFTKNQLVKCGILPENSTWTFLASSTVSGACVPADTALTWMYNQPTIRNADGKIVGALYKDPIDCLWKTVKTEGVRGWYKGSTAHFLRIAPHT